VKGSMALIDPARAASLYDVMAAGIEASGGSAANTAAGVASFGGKVAFIGKVADDQLGNVFRHDMKAIGCDFHHAVAGRGPGHRPEPDQRHRRRPAHHVDLSGRLRRADPADVDPAIIEAAKYSYLEGYLFDPPEARRAFAKAAALSHGAGRKISMTLSDSFMVDRHRGGPAGLHRDPVRHRLRQRRRGLLAVRDRRLRRRREGPGRALEIAAVTRSEKGSVVASGGQLHEISAYPVEKVVDTTGAGDQYAAGFLYGLSQGRPLPVCGQLGSLAAAEVIDHYGPRPQVNLRELAAKNGL
jgi:sugar/nucleoside kinase (ribokinase family)